VSQVFVELLHGQHAHADSRACVDVTAEVAGRRPAAGPHSVFELVWHMNYWMDYELARIAGRPRPYPEHAALSWPAAPAPEPAAWAAEVARFGEQLGRLGELARSGEAELARPIAPSHESEARHAASLESVLWQTLVHNSYHLGQVAMVRQMLGAWPPRSGSDTW